MDHTYLFVDASWEAAGEFTGRSGRTVPLEGRERIAHGAEGWTLESRMRTLGERGFEVANDYRIVPFAPGAASAPCTAENTVLGRLDGRFAVVGDTILSSYETADGRFSGVEASRQLDADTYENRGILFEGDEVASTWAVTLRRR